MILLRMANEDEFTKRYQEKGDGEMVMMLTWNELISLAGSNISATRRDQAPHDSTTGPSSQPEEEHQRESDPLNLPQHLIRRYGKTGSDSGKSTRVFAGPTLRHMAEAFLAIAYPRFMKPGSSYRRSVIEENPESHSSSMPSVNSFRVIAPITGFHSKLILVTPPPFNTEEATTITTISSELTHSSTSARVARLSKRNSEHEDARIGKLQSRIGSKEKKTHYAASSSATPPRMMTKFQSKPRASDALLPNNIQLFTSTRWQSSNTSDYVVKTPSLHRSDTNQNILNNP
ncbi:hypothetical protein Tco_1312493 [Tanacetum coccineum]